MAESRKVTVPDIGDFDRVEVVEILVSEGDSVQVDDSLITLESDKASMDVPSPSAGTVRKLLVAAGDEVATGDAILELDAADGSPGVDDRADETAEGAPVAASGSAGSGDASTGGRDAPTGDAAQPTGRASEAGRQPVRAAAVSSAAELPYASPAVRKLAREKGVDLDRIDGSGRKGRILAEDVEQAARGEGAGEGAGVLPPMPDIDFSEFGETEEQPLTRINKLTGKNVHRSWLHVPHVTQFDEADITGLEEFRKASKQRAEQEGFKLTFVSFLIAAAAAALREHPRFNSSLSPDGERVILKKYVNIGVAVDTPKGLVVPVVRDAGRKRLFELAEELSDVSERARDGKLTPSDFQGGTFTISSLGGIGGTGFTPIVNAPEVAILGVSRAAMQPVWQGGEFVPRLVLPFALSYDHRVIDGAAAARFTTTLAHFLSDVRRLLL